MAVKMAIVGLTPYMVTLDQGLTQFDDYVQLPFPLVLNIQLKGREKIIILRYNIESKQKYISAYCFPVLKHFMTFVLSLFIIMPYFTFNRMLFTW